MYSCSHCPVRIRTRLSGDNINKKLLGTKCLFITTAGPFQMKIWLTWTCYLWKCLKEATFILFRVICQKVIMKRASPRDSLCLSGPEDLWWPWEGLRKQKVEMDSDSLSSKRLNQHFVIVYWCKRLICFHITVYFLPSFLDNTMPQSRVISSGFWFLISNWKIFQCIKQRTSITLSF